MALGCYRVGVLPNKELGDGQLREGRFTAMVAMGLCQFQRWPWYRAPHLWPWYTAPQSLSAGVHDAEWTGVWQASQPDHEQWGAGGDSYRTCRSALLWSHNFNPGSTLQLNKKLSNKQVKWILQRKTQRSFSSKWVSWEVADGVLGEPRGCWALGCCQSHCSSFSTLSSNWNFN